MSAKSIIEAYISEAVKTGGGFSSGKSGGLTMKQKVGYRKAARTRERRAYAEDGGTYHEYYARPKIPTQS